MRKQLQTPKTLRSIWPDEKPFGLFLSHDVDQIHDREVFHCLASMNHIRRMVMQGEAGNVKLALQRLARMLFKPKSPYQDFQTILDIEARYGFRSTFFVLHDVKASKNGPRYRLDDLALKRIVEMVRGEKELRNTRNIRKIIKCEIGLHGGVKCLNQADHYRQCREDLEAAFSLKVNGIRNHLLRHDGGPTWAAQAAAGFGYDATYGDSDALGPKDGHMFPFFACDAVSPSHRLTGSLGPSASPTTDNRFPDSPSHRLPDSPTHRPTDSPTLLVLPLTVMDCTLFRSLKLKGDEALEAAWQAITPVIEAGGLVSLLWHNNYFNEPEYADWQWVYEQLLERLAKLNPWCATGAEIAEWWRGGIGESVNRLSVGR